jgi:hypothetical protein
VVDNILDIIVIGDFVDKVLADVLEYVLEVAVSLSARIVIDRRPEKAPGMDGLRFVDEPQKLPKPRKTDQGVRWPGLPAHIVV